MAPEGIPEDVLRFIADALDSVEQLKVLLLLYNSPDRSWTVQEITDTLRSAESSIAKRLDDLYERKVLLRDPANPDLHRFIPASRAIAEIVRRLDEADRSRPYQLIDAIYSAPPRDLSALANAFKFRGGS